MSSHFKLLEEEYTGSIERLKNVLERISLFQAGKIKLKSGL